MIELYRKTAHELRDMVKNKEIKVEEMIKGYIDRIEKVDKKIEACLYVAIEEALDKARKFDKKIEKKEALGKLWGVPIGLKDNISVKGMQNTCASNMLKDYISPYHANVTKKLVENNGIIIAKLNMDEFAMGSSTENSSFKISKNPWNLNRVPGGSSGGSAAAVASGEIPLALGTETGGSVRQPASFCGVVGLKPTYGRISRYGITAFGSTLDQVGILGKDVEDCAILTEVVAGFDSRDFTTANVPVQEYASILNKNIKGKRIGVPKELFGEELDNQVKKVVMESIEVLKENGAEIVECSIPLINYSLAAYYIISSAEASSNLSRFDGIRYGHRTKYLEKGEDIYTNSRTEGFGEEVKRRIMLGTYVLSKGYYDEYYKKALKVRKLISQEFSKVMKEFDAIVSPTVQTTAFKIGEKTKDVLSMYMSDIYTVPANIAGLPAISIPCGSINNLPIGLQIIGNHFREDVLFNIAYSFEQSINWDKKMPEI